MRTAWHTCRQVGNSGGTMWREVRITEAQVAVGRHGGPMGRQAVPVVCVLVSAQKNVPAQVMKATKSKVVAVLPRNRGAEDRWVISNEDRG